MPTKNTEKEISTLYYKEDKEAEWKPFMKTNNILETPLVTTGDIVKRKGKYYEVIIADENIFVICRLKWSNKERSYITKYNRPEVYANQRDINTLEELGFEKI